ncbi:phage integrase family protein [Mycobacteroides abscessus subsp. abscessus]|uniref:tyrosine-type recombinase/integrase n=1 Tax=Mycobacteroides abscessus TaxID=36809 RepID=UPI000926E9AD|nr:tyrosine-type recombinase/integrase [Mycobacteroides abscessus]SHT43712.1 phage integrase family protein [Mycobacteroides abscessus subsp. abscessus]SLK74588.1 phage integrase family protein [Mycobacteroides abscessus subsp. abscessus]
MTAPKRAARKSVIDLWHRPARAGEQVYYPADQSDGPVWCMDRTHFKKTATMVCTTRHGQGKRWRAAWVDHDGQQRAKAFDNKADAQQYIDGITTALNSGTYADPQRSGVTFGIVAEAWIKTKEATNRAPKTVEGYRGLLEVVILPKWEHHRLKDVDHERLQTWFTWLSTDPAARQRKSKKSDAGLSPARVIQIHNAMHQVFEYAIRAKYLAVNPADHIELPSKPQSSKDLALTHDQVSQLAAEMVNAEAAVRYRSDTAKPLVSPETLASMVRFLAYSGLRFGECASLRVGDVDTDNRRVHVSKGVTGVRGRGRIEGDTKTHQKRYVPILTTWLNDELKQVVAGRDPSEFLFPGPDGGAMTEGWFRVRFDKAVAKLGIEGVTPHTLRHTAGSLAISESPTATGVLLASKLLGHSNPTTTANVYSHTLSGDWEKLAASMENATKPAV